MPDQFAERVGPILQGELAQGETLRGIAAATLQKTFSGGLFAIGVTDRRLLLQQLDRKLQPKEAAVPVAPEALASGDIEGAGPFGSTEVIDTAAIVDAVSITVRLQTTEGRRFKLMMMKGGDGMLGGLAGGPSQTEGVRALVEWLNANAPRLKP
jgi:hypothetical protein